MKFNKVFSFLTACAFVVGMSTFALAANRVEVKVTSEPVPFQSSCSKAGGFSLEFDEGTALTVGDVITIDTDLGTTICPGRGFDIMIAPEGNIQLDTNGNYLAGTLWDATTTPIADSAFTQTVATTITGTGVVFRIIGTAGTQRITIYVLGPVGNSISVTNADTQQADLVTLKFLDEKTNPTANPAGPATWSDTSVWEDSTDNSTTVDRIYDDSADWVDNTLCIVAASDFNKNVVNGNMDSKNDKFSFIPSNPQIAHIATKTDISLYACKNAAIGNIPLPKDDQAGCNPFDYETGAGYCAGSNGRIVLNKTTPFESSESYAVRLEIVSPTTNVYWGGSSVGYTAMTTPSCTVTAAATFASATAYNSANNKLTSFTGGGATCSIDAAQQAKILETVSNSAVFTGVDQKALFIDLPPFAFVKGVSEGDKVEVKVTLLKYPCGELFTQTVHVGTFGCASSASATLIYPYFTPIQATDGWWDGFVIDNLTATAGTATITLYEADGDQGTLTGVAVAANSQYVQLLSSILDSINPASTNTGTLGDSTCYIKVVTNFTADGFAMMGDGTQAQGYLPKGLVSTQLYH